jgi:centromere protein I
LDELVDIIRLPNELDQASIANIIRNLYPATKVSNDTVIKVVGSLGHGQSRAAFPVQTMLLKWLVMVHDVLEDQKILSQLYSFLFNLLDTIAIRYDLV